MPLPERISAETERAGWIKRPVRSLSCLQLSGSNLKEGGSGRGGEEPLGENVDTACPLLPGLLSPTLVMLPSF